MVAIPTRLTDDCLTVPLLGGGFDDEGLHLLPLFIVLYLLSQGGEAPRTQVVWFLVPETDRRVESVTQSQSVRPTDRVSQTQIDSEADKHTHSQTDR